MEFPMELDLNSILLIIHRGHAHVAPLGNAYAPKFHERVGDSVTLAGSHVPTRAYRCLG